MKYAEPATIFLKDYREPDYLVDTVFLTFDIQPDKTRVIAEIVFRCNYRETENNHPDLILNGSEEMELESVLLDGNSLSADGYEQTRDKLIIKPPSASFTTKITTLVDPGSNTSLEGLYQSGNMYCTQCEAEGFRKITFYPDRPDVMARFTTKIIADKEQFPVLLSNGNMTGHETLDDGRHTVTWHDPFPKPSYLFALVAGDLEYIEDHFVTQSGKNVTLRLFTEAHNISKCDHAMLSLKRSMKWDEDIYGREYDLDLFMIVAVDSFNMGAMENKGLNIFNSACVLARPDTATDSSFQTIESIVGHEYFHNWSGNRVTCRDWFQLSLKEGFTVFRDQEFSADMNSRTVKRIEDVSVLRNVQFVEDAGPLAHPVRPDSFIEISNFYTSTVYDKGAEVVRMLHNIVGSAVFRKGTDLYFDRHDGQAVTCDDFVKAIEDASDVDLTVFRRWYSQSGTPVVEVTDNYHPETGKYTLTFRQSCPETPGQKEKLPFHIPVSIGLISKNDGVPLPVNNQGDETTVLHLKEREECFTFENIQHVPLPSLLRGFSAPVKLVYDYSPDELLMLIRHDTDGFNRWDSMQRLALHTLVNLTGQYRENRPLTMDDRLTQAFGSLLEGHDADLALVAEMLKLPSVSYVGEHMGKIDVYAIDAARTFAEKTVAKRLRHLFSQTFERLDISRPYEPKADHIAMRSLKNVCLAYLAIDESFEGLDKARKQLDQSGNMTDVMAALHAMTKSSDPEAKVILDKSLELFANKWRQDTNVMDMWFSVQARAKTTFVTDIQRLMKHPCFDFKNPNKVRSLLGAFCAHNMVNFHEKNGHGYSLLADAVIDMDSLNPQMASRLVIPLTRWKRYVPGLQEKMRQALQKIAESSSLSPDLYEVVTRALS